MKDRMQGTKPGFRPHWEDFQANWTKNIPEHWEVRRLKFVAKTIAGQSPPSEIVSEFTGRYPFLQGNAEFGATFPSPRLSCEKPNKSAEPGDILLSVRAPVGAMNVADQIYGIGRGLCAIRANASIYQEFLYHTLTTTKETLKGASTGSTYDAVSIGDVASISTPVPPLEEQAAIVRFLDHADEQIQRYIAGKERLIALLEEERQALVHQAVTRGLDLSVRFKDSGVEWLGEVPEHWPILTLGQIAESLKTGPFGSMLHQSDYIQGGIPVINPIHLRGGVVVEDPKCSVSEPMANRLSDYRLAHQDIVFSRRGELGRCALVGKRETNWLCGTGSIRVRIGYEGIEPEFLIRALQVKWVGEYLSLASVGATMNNLNTGILKSVPVLVPPVREQMDIVEYVNERSRAIDWTISSARRQIDLMNEYRTRLIADVVTGQLDVRDGNFPTDAVLEIGLRPRDKILGRPEDPREYP